MQSRSDFIIWAWQISVRIIVNDLYFFAYFENVVFMNKICMSKNVETVYHIHSFPLKHFNSSLSLQEIKSKPKSRKHISDHRLDWSKETLDSHISKCFCRALKTRFFYFLSEDFNKVMKVWELLKDIFQPSCGINGFKAMAGWQSNGK